MSTGRENEFVAVRRTGVCWLPAISIQDSAMTLCPIALAVGCKKCPAFNVCPVKSVIGDYKPEAAAPPAKNGKAKTKK